VLAAGLAVGGTGVWWSGGNFDPWPHFLAEESVGLASAWDGPDIVFEDVEFSEGEAPAPMLP